MDGLIFSGSLKECLIHFAQSKWTKDPLEALAIFTGASLRGAVEYWAKGRNKPIGEYALKAQHYLAFVGYGVAEVERLDMAIRELGEATALEMLTVDQLAEELRYGGALEGRRSQLFTVLLAGRGMMPDKMIRARELAQKYHAELERKKEELRKSLPRLKSAAVPIIVRESRPTAERIERVHTESGAQQADTVQQTVPHRREEPVRSGNRSIVIAAMHAKSLRDHVNSLLNGSDKDRSEFRRLAGDVKSLGEDLLLIASE